MSNQDKANLKIVGQFCSIFLALISSFPQCNDDLSLSSGNTVLSPPPQIGRADQTLFAHCSYKLQEDYKPRRLGQDISGGDIK